MAVLRAELREHVIREVRQEIRGLAREGLTVQEIRRRVQGSEELPASETELTHLTRSSVQTLLGPGIAQGARDSHELAATVVLKMLPTMQGVRLRELLGWIQGSDEELVSECLLAAVHPDVILGELSSTEREALIEVLRSRAESSEP